ncbi:MAG: stress response translation initiation inhibitor YciH [DPANN group archaeon]|nr:stress response translation initiation inhibitor YciH [DPANN group archaeon]
MDEICQVCGLPKEICVCQEIAKSGQKIRVTSETRRFKKNYTIISGFDENTDLQQIGKELKQKLACGGTTKNNRIELQGEHKQKVKKALIEMGYTNDQIDMY